MKQELAMTPKLTNWGNLSQTLPSFHPMNDLTSLAAVVALLLPAVKNDSPDS